MAQAGSILKKTVAEDRGLVDVPQLVPHFESRLLEDRQVALVSETFSTLLRGPVYTDLLPLLDGRRSFRDIVAALAASHAESTIRTALVALASRGYVVSGDHSLDPETAAYWCSLGVSPRWAEERLRASAVSIAGDDGRLARHVQVMNVKVDAEHSALSVHVCADYLDSRHEAVNRRHLASGAPWMLLCPAGTRPRFGPIFRPAERGPCWSCLAYRLRRHHEVHTFLRTAGGEDDAFRPRTTQSVVLNALYGLVAAEIAKWLVLGDMALLHERAISLDVDRLEIEHHRTMRRPQCRACGSDAGHRPDGVPTPVRLEASPKLVRNSGGVRSVPPEETLARYRHLVSPVSGVVTRVSRLSHETDTWFHVHSAKANPFGRIPTLDSLRRCLRFTSAGKGSTRAQSEASALCEAVERYCAAFHGEEVRVRRRFADFVDAGNDAAIHPNEVLLFSDRQLDEAARLNARGEPYREIPERLYHDAELSWSPVWSLTDRRHKYLPTSILYLGMQAREIPKFQADTNGCAAGNTLEEAILQGFFELVERDAVAVWWYNRLSLPGVDLESFDDELLGSSRDRCRRLHRELWMLDVTGDLGIPVFVAVSRRVDRDGEDIRCSAGAHVDPQIAALRAVSEMQQLVLPAQPPPDGTGAEVSPHRPPRWRNIRLAEHPWLAPAAGAQHRGRSDYRVPDTSDVREDIEACRALVETRGLEFLVLNQTRPDIGMPVARVIVPGLRHFHERFAPGRLFDVPVAMGWRDGPLAEQDLNPVPGGF